MKDKKCQNLKIQIGAGEIPPNITDDEITLEYYRYKDSLIEDILEADLVIGHAGAGTCLEVLENGKPLITVINERLMGNHQIELADKLSSEGYSICCTCANLGQVIQHSEIDKLKPFIYDNDKRCALYIEKLFDTNIKS